ncbi:SDR family NAD(P)-dependent oxidoreductase [Porticoccus sp.]
MNIRQKKIVIIGATSCIAEHCARFWAEGSPSELILVGRDSTKTELVAADLRVRTPGTVVTTIETDFLDPVKIQELANEINNTGAADIVLIAHGLLPDQQNCQTDLNACEEALKVNAISPVMFAESFVGYMEAANKGTLAIIGSVAGDRGRKTNYVYGAAKGLVARYAQGLQHRLAKTEVKVVLIKPGPTDSPMTAHLKVQNARLATVEKVAKGIVDGIAREKPLVYVPVRWELIMWIIQHLPARIFNRLDI